MIIEQWMSDELKNLSPELTAQQWAGVMTIIKKELEGVGITALLESAERPCATSTYYGRWSKKKKGQKSKGGWVDNPNFTQALAWARRDYRSWLMEQGTSEAMQVLAKAAAPAARDLERQVTGDSEAVEILSQQLDQAVNAQNEPHIIKLALALGNTQQTIALPALTRALGADLKAGARTALIEAVGAIAAPLNVDRQKADMGILDRAGEATAAKAVSHEKGEHEQRLSVDLREFSTEFLESLLRPEGGSEEVPGGGDPGGTE